MREASLHLDLRLQPHGGPFSPFGEAGPRVPSLGFVFPAAQPTGACLLRASVGARLWGRCGCIWKLFGRASAPTPPPQRRPPASKQQLISACCRLGLREAAGLRPTALTSGGGRGRAEETGVPAGLRPPASSRNHISAGPKRHKRGPQRPGRPGPRPCQRLLLLLQWPRDAVTLTSDLTSLGVKALHL